MEILFVFFCFFFVLKSKLDFIRMKNLKLGKYPPDIYLVKVNSKDSRKKLARKTPVRRY